MELIVRGSRMSFKGFASFVFMLCSALDGVWLAILIMIVLLAPSLAFAQESGRQWVGISSPGVFNTQYEAEQALNSKYPDPLGRPLVLYQVAFNPTSTEATYWRGTWPQNIGQWGRYGLAGGGEYLTEAEAVQSAVAELNKASENEYCNSNDPGYKNASLEPIEEWGPDFRSNGEAEDSQTRKYRQSYYGPTGSSNCTNFVVITAMRRSRAVSCPVGFRWSAGNGGCTDVSSKKSIASYSTVACDDCGFVGNPVYLSTGQKFQEENDLDIGWINLTRYFQSNQANIRGGFGYGWTHSWSTRIIPDTWAGFRLVQANGFHLSFKKVAGGEYVYEAIDGSGDRLVGGTPNILYQKDAVTYFNSVGLMVEKRFPDGRWLKFSYDPQDRLVRVTHASGRSLELSYLSVGALDDARVESISSDGVMLASYSYGNGRRLESVSYSDGSSRIYHYEDPRFPMSLTGVTDEAAVRFSTFAYDSKGRVISSVHAGGADGTSLSYTAAGGALVTDALGRSANYQLTTGGSSNPYRKLTGVVDSEGSDVRAYLPEAVDFRRRLALVTDKLGVKTKYEYSQTSSQAPGILLSTEVVKYAYGTAEEFEVQNSFDAFTNRIVSTRRGTLEVSYGRNDRGQVSAIAQTDMETGASRTTAISYCEAIDDMDAIGPCPRIGLPKVIDGPRTDVQDTISFRYYKDDGMPCAGSHEGCGYRAGDLWKSVNGLGHVTEVLAYDEFGRPLATKGVDGVVSEALYYPRGWLAAVTVKGATALEDRSTLFEYWPTGLVKQITDPDGSTLSYEYDQAHRLVAVIDGLGNRIEYVLDAAGNRLSESVKGTAGEVKLKSARIFDQMGRLTTIMDAASNDSHMSYDAVGNLKTFTDANGVGRQNEYDALRRLTRTVQSVAGDMVQTQYDYDKNGNVSAVTDPNGFRTTYSYDGLGQLKIITSPDTGATQRTFDSAGNVKTSTDARGITATYGYDALNRVTSISYPAAGDDVVYTYDTVPAGCAAGEVFGTGRLSSVFDASGRTDYCYSRFGDVLRKIQVTNGKVFEVRYTYTAGGRLASVIYPNGVAADYVRDSQGRIIEVGVTSGISGRQVLLNGVSYLAFGPTAGWAYGNGRALVRTFDLDYRPTGVVDSAQDLKIGLSYDAVGDVVGLTSKSYAAALTHDALGRLIVFSDAASNAPVEQYSYDATGNRLSFSNVSGNDAYTYNAGSHRLASVAGLARSYDAAGNTIGMNGAGKELIYNQAGRLSQVKRAGLLAQKYSYNAHGERVQRGLDSGNAVYTTYDEAGHWLGDYDALGNTMQQVIWMDDMPVGLLADGVLHYIEPDHLGTPRLVFNPMRNVAVWTWDIKGELFGNTEPNQDPDIDGQAFVFDMRFPGQRYDAVSGLNYNYYRDYDPSTGRYVQSDPIGLAGGVSTYGYVGGGPLGAVDPLGLQSASRAIGFQSSGGIGAFNPNDPMSYERRSSVDTSQFEMAADVAGQLADPINWVDPNGPNRLILDALVANMMSPSDQRKAEHRVYKDYQRSGYKRDPDQCRQLRNQIEFHQRLNLMRHAFDMRWMVPQFPLGRHAQPISEGQATIRKLEAQYERECSDECR